MKTGTRIGTFRIAVAILVLAALVPVAGALAHLDAFVGAGGPPAYTFHLLMNLVALLALVFAGILAWRTPVHPGARALTLWIGFGVFAWAWGFLARSGAPVVPGWSGDDPVLRGLAGLLGIGAVGAAALWFARFGGSFPRELTAADMEAVRRIARESPERLPLSDRFFLRVARLSPALRRLNEIHGVILGALRFLRSAGGWTLPALLVAGFALLRLAPPGFDPRHIMFVLVLVLAVLPASFGPVCLRALYSVATGSERRQLLWLSWAIVPALAAIAMGGGHFVGSGGIEVVSWLPVVMPLGVLLLLVGLFNAVFFHGVLDPALAIRKTVLYGGLAIVLTVIFELVQTLASETMVAWLGLPDRVGGISAAVVVALVLAPLHTALRVRTDRLLRDATREPEPVTAPAAEA